MSVATAILGPLVVPECRRALGRGWLVLVRTLSAFCAGAVALSIVWWWWFEQTIEDPGFPPYELLRGGLIALESIAITLAVVLSPAVLAGSLAGEKERGSMGLLLTTRISPREIVAGRLAGKLSQVGMILLAGVPAFILLAALAGIRLGPLATMFALPAAVAFGGAGIAAASSAVSRRGRDALLVVYLLDVLFLLTPLLSWLLPSVPVGFGIGALNPFRGVVDLVWYEDIHLALGTMLFWTVLGLGGAAVAAWRLRPACLHLLGGETKRGRGSRRWGVPPVNEEKPMLWKELFIERAGSLGRFGRWLGLLIVLALGLGSTVLAGIAIWSMLIDPDAEMENFAVNAMKSWIGATAFAASMLIQCAIGLRAAVAVSSERERGSWDALLTSPLEGGEIVRGKLMGSFNALRWLVLAAVIAWSLTLVFGAMTWRTYVFNLLDLIVCGAFMAAIGVRVSLATGTATRSLAITIGIWLAASAIFWIASLILVGMLFLVCLGLWYALAQLGLVTQATMTPPWLRGLFEYGQPIIRLALYVAATGLVVLEAGLRFDRIAGRMAGGGVQAAVDRVLHGTPMAPVLVDPEAARAAALADGEESNGAADQPVQREGAVEPA